jgi:F0F1-type ATP synthase epsilon subunit
MSLKPIKVVVKNTDEVLFDGEVERISSYNEVGRFDVYPMHANFISIIQKELQLFHEKRLIKEFKLERAIMKVKQDVVNIFMGIESLAIDEETLGEPADKKNEPTTANKK